ELESFGDRPPIDGHVRRTSVVQESRECFLRPAAHARFDERSCDVGSSRRAPVRADEPRVRTEVDPDVRAALADALQPYAMLLAHRLLRVSLPGEPLVLAPALEEAVAGSAVLFAPQRVPTQQRAPMWFGQRTLLFVTGEPVVIGEAERFDPGRGGLLPDRGR